MSLIFVIDDDIDLRDALRGVLEADGHTVIDACDGAFAVEAAAEHQPALVLLDMCMASVGGLEALRALKANSRTCDIPVLMVTVLDRDTCIEAAFILGACDYLVKPFSADEAQRLVRKVLDEHAALTFA